MAHHRRYVDTVIRMATQKMLSYQREDGAFSFCCEVNPLPDALVIIFLQMLNEVEDVLIPALCNRLLANQNPNGSWSSYPNQNGNISATSLAYFALLLSDYPKHSAPLQKARDFILSNGGITKASSMTKIIFAVAGQISWHTLPNPHIDMMMWDNPIPVTIRDFTAPARVHIPSIMLLSHLRFHFRLSRQYSMKDLIDVSRDLPQDDFRALNVRAIDRCRRFILSRLEADGTIGGYLTATVFAVFALMALGYSRQHPLLHRSVRGVHGLLYCDRHFIHQQIFTSTVWDTALCLQAVNTAKQKGIDEVRKRATKYLLERQHHRLSDWTYHASNTPPGGWAFSDVNTLYPDVDDTTAALSALYPVRKLYRHQWKRGMKWLLDMQNDDGGWSAFDRNCNKVFLELIAINDMGRAMTDPSTCDITGHVLELLGRGQSVPKQCVQEAIQWLLKQQRPDGSWDGRWGIKYIYGTAAVLCGLRACGFDMKHNSVQRAHSWLCSIQNRDGGYGESCASEKAGTYVPLNYSTASQTAWALLALLSTDAHSQACVKNAVGYLITSACRTGGWKEAYPTGAAIKEQAYIRYHSYAYVWPIMALSEYRAKVDS